MRYLGLEIRIGFSDYLGSLELDYYTDVFLSIFMFSISGTHSLPGEINDSEQVE